MKGLERRDNIEIGLVRAIRKFEEYLYGKKLYVIV